MFETIRPFLQAENDCALAAALPGQLGKTLWIQAVVYKIRHMSGFSFVLLQFPDALVQAIAGARVFPLSDGTAAGVSVRSRRGVCGPGDPQPPWL